jgi:teichuronic acid exporter
VTGFKQNIIFGSIWAGGGQLLTMIVLLVSNIWMARLLGPNAFGQMGLIMFFIIIFTVFTESGLSGALVRKTHTTELDYSTVFIFNLCLSILSYTILFFSSGFISNYYHDPDLQLLIEVAGIVLIINSFQIIQDAKLITNFKFKEKSVYRFVSVTIGSCIGIVSCYMKFGVWSIVYMQISMSIVQSSLLWYKRDANLKISFSLQSLKQLYRFGVNTTLASLINTAFDNIYNLILGKYFSLFQVAFYYQAKKLQDVPGGIINTITQSVVFSSLSKMQEDSDQFLNAYNKVLNVFIVALGLISTFIYVYAEQIIKLLFGLEWIDSIFFLKMLSVASFFTHLELINRVVFKVFDKTRQLLILEIVKKLIQLIGILVSVRYHSINLMLICLIVSNIIGYFLSYFFSRKILKTNNSYEFKVCTNIILISICCILIVNSILTLFESIYFGLLITFPILIVLYLLFLRAIKIFNIIEFLNQMKIRN